ncbi:hypothetical protein J6590_083376 [Homalodisca vitripennis]|nr:hypothetical protein J6590_083376 [Homalodisca vitripennis]
MQQYKEIVQGVPCASEHSVLPVAQLGYILREITSVATTYAYTAAARLRGICKQLFSRRELCTSLLFSKGVNTSTMLQPLAK